MHKHSEGKRKWKFGGVVLLLLMVSALSVIALAQEASVSSLLAAAHAAAQKYPDAEAVYLHSDETVKIDPAGNIRDTVHRTVLLQAWDKKAAERYGYEPLVVRIDSQERERKPAADLLQSLLHRLLAAIGHHHRLTP